jgi:glyoxylase-like metal-dependent hydrolase (beta-lactamase superfamily II)
MGLYLRQLLAGVDFAVDNGFASQMANFVYVIADDQTRECLVVDPAWDVRGILAELDREDLKLTGALVTHYHPDHIGGDIFGHRILGLEDLLSTRPVRIHVNAAEADGVKQVTGVSEADLVRHSGGDRIAIGGIEVTFLHTPGHTPGSQCFLVEESLISGDTLFIKGCGRVDLPGGDADQLYYSLTQTLAALPDQTKLFPGHNYSRARVSTMGEVKRENFCMRMSSLDDWRSLMGVQ